MMGYVDREKLQKQLNWLRREIIINEENDLNGGLQAIDILDDVEKELEYVKDTDMREAFKNGWINVKERLPEVPEGQKFVEVLTLHRWSTGVASYNILRYYAVPDVYREISAGWHSKPDFWDSVVDWEIGLTHWMPLPEPPTEDEEEAK